MTRVSILSHCALAGTKSNLAFTCEILDRGLSRLVTYARYRRLTLSKIENDDDTLLFTGKKACQNPVVGHGIHKLPSPQSCQLPSLCIASLGLCSRDKCSRYMPAIIAGLVSVLSPCMNMDDVATGKGQLHILRYGLHRNRAPPVGWAGGRNMINKLQRCFGSMRW